MVSGRNQLRRRRVDGVLFAGCAGAANESDTLWSSFEAAAMTRCDECAQALGRANSVASPLDMAPVENSDCDTLGAWTVSGRGAAGKCALGSSSVFTLSAMKPRACVQTLVHAKVTRKRPIAAPRAR